MDIMNLNFNKTLCFTGHRPDKLHGYDYKSEGNVKLLKKIRKLLIRLIEVRGFDTFISGMALGTDMWCAKLILGLKKRYPHIKLVCAIPCAEQYSRWNEGDQRMYHDILSQADLVHCVSDKSYAPWLMIKRDEWMVDNSNFVFSVWNGDESGGTWKTVEYAVKRQRKIMNIHPHSLEIELNLKI